MDNKQAQKEMLKLWKSGLDTYIKTVTSMQEQGEKLLDQMLQQGETLGEESKKLLKEWASNAKELQKNYLDALQENLKKIEEML